MSKLTVIYENGNVTITEYKNNSVRGKAIKALLINFGLVEVPESTKENMIFKAFNLRVLKTGKEFLHITEHGSGTKMHDIESISTSCQRNEYCVARSKIPGTICEKCYADTYLDMRDKLAEYCERNFDILNAGIILPECLPIIDTDIFRFESFGDVATVYAVINFFNICYKNKNTQFTVWTKNYFLYWKVIKKLGYRKPKNLILIVSSPYINRELDISKYEFANKVFTVYDSKYIKENGININCGSRDCRSCMKCYTRNEKTKYIAEKKK